MKKLFIVIILVPLLLLQSCGQPEPDETKAETVLLPEVVTEDYGTEWAYAGMDKQIEADDTDFSVTGKNFEYRDGWLGVDTDGFFDVTVNYEPGSDEKFSFEFDYFVKDNGVLWLGLWLYGKDCLPNDGIPGEWIKLSYDGALYGGQTYGSDKKETVKIKLTAGPDGFTVFANGSPIIRTDKGSDNGGGAIKLRSENCPVYISNIAFRIGN